MAAQRLAKDAYLLTTIVRLLPVSSTKMHSIMALCKAFPHLSRHIAPSNESFWREMVLSDFDFSEHPETVFNVEGDHIQWFEEMTKENLRDYEDDENDADMENCDDDNDSGKGTEDDIDMEGEGEDEGGDSDDDDDEGDAENEEGESEDEEEETWKTGEHDEEEEGDGEEDEVTLWSIHPAREHVEKWDAKNPDRNPHTLLTDMRFWSALGVFFRPHEFGFLNGIQSGTSSMDAWPSCEDAFSLYRDSCRLRYLRLGFHERLVAPSDGCRYVEPCLLSRFHGRFDNGPYEFLKHCNIVPHFWYNPRGQAVSKRWKRIGMTLSRSNLEKFQRELENENAEEDSEDEEDGDEDEEDADEEMNGVGEEDEADEGDEEHCDDDDEEEEEEEEEDDEDEEEGVFPRLAYHVPEESTVLRRLKRFVQATCDDWRRAHVNLLTWDYESPEFYIGASKGSGRWIGFVGHSAFFTRND